MHINGEREKKSSGEQSMRLKGNKREGKRGRESELYLNQIKSARQRMEVTKSRNITNDSFLQ